MDHDLGRWLDSLNDEAWLKELHDQDKVGHQHDRLCEWMNGARAGGDIPFSIANAVGQELHAHHTRKGDILAMLLWDSVKNWPLEADRRKP